MLTILRLDQMQRVSSTVLRRKYQEHIAMLASLWRRTRRLILDNIVRTALLLEVLLNEAMLRKREDREGPWVYRDVGSDPVTHLAPFGILARRRVGVCERDDICWVGVCGTVGTCVFVQGDGWGTLEMFRLDGVAKLCIVFLPGYGKGQAWEEVIDHYQRIRVGSNDSAKVLPVGMISAFLSLRRISFVKREDIQVHTQLAQPAHPECPSA